MDATEIARLREINDGFGRPAAQRSRLTVGEVRALLDALEQARKETERLDRSEDQLIGERDAAEETLSQAYYLVIGRSPGWSSLFGHKEALEEIDDAQSAFRAAVSQRDAARQSAEAARALLVESKEYVSSRPYANHGLRARIEAFLEPKV